MRNCIAHCYKKISTRPSRTTSSLCCFGLFCAAPQVLLVWLEVITGDTKYGAWRRWLGGCKGLALTLSHAHMADGRDSMRMHGYAVQKWYDLGTKRCASNLHATTPGGVKPEARRKKAAGATRRASSATAHGPGKKCPMHAHARVFPAKVRVACIPSSACGGATMPPPRRLGQAW